VPAPSAVSVAGVAIRSAIYVPLSGTFGDARRLVALCEQAEQAGWDGFFTWDVLYSGVEPTLDPWVVLSACAARTNSITLGALVTPVARRRPVKLARELLSLDQLSGGRVVAGVGLGDSSELRMIGEEVSAAAFAQRFEA
jgi:alkanesulfonate monooxygenase SsuD/methylene tetrahydromethanopterin reductase-like flavin-dependent oxidoreductase (luciferase family)